MKNDLWKVSQEEAKIRALLAFEFAVMIADVAISQNIPFSKELVEIAEDILIKEMSISDNESFAGKMNMLALAVFGSYENTKTRAEVESSNDTE